VRKGLALALPAIMLASAAGCASPQEAERPLPAWFVARKAELEREGYPKLENVPSRVDANVNQEHWDQVTRELEAARAEMQANPRSERPPTPTEDAAAVETFDEKARTDLDAARARNPE
jgi:hypothetical protein